jgi:hypothetical protein
MANISIDELSLTISELVDLDPEQQTLIESALIRAVSAKDIVGGAYPPQPPTIGGAMAPGPKLPGPDDGTPDTPPIKPKVFVGRAAPPG